MNRYWDLTEKQRSELTEEQVEAMLDVEKMEKGVFDPEPPELLPIEECPEPDVLMYGPKHGYGAPDLVFANAEDAAKFSVGACKIENEYMSGSTFKVVSDAGDMEIEAVKLYSRSAFQKYRALIEKNASAKKHNEAEQDKFNKAKKKLNEAVSGVWTDYRECLSLSRDCKKVIDTFNEYTRICDGDTEKAFVFLGKAFDEDEIRTAFEWNELEMPSVELVSVASTSSEVSTDEIL